MASKIAALQQEIKKKDDEIAVLQWTDIALEVSVAYATIDEGRALVRQLLDVVQTWKDLRGFAVKMRRPDEQSPDAQDMSSRV